MRQLWYVFQNISFNNEFQLESKWHSQCHWILHHQSQLLVDTINVLSGNNFDILKVISMVRFFKVQPSAKQWQFLGWLKFQKRANVWTIIRAWFFSNFLAVIKVLRSYESLIFQYFWIFMNFSTFLRFFVQNVFERWATVTCLQSLDLP